MNNTLAEALDEELLRLHKVENIPYENEKLDSKKGIKVKVNNPELIKRFKEFAQKYKLEKR